MYPSDTFEELTSQPLPTVEKFDMCCDNYASFQNAADSQHLSRRRFRTHKKSC